VGAAYWPCSPKFFCGKALEGNDIQGSWMSSDIDIDIDRERERERKKKERPFICPVP
jgi:hypothetical protein